MKEHNEKVYLTVQDLIISRNNTFDNIVNLAMSGEMNHLADAIDVGDKYTFTLNHFRTVEDKNVQILLQICDNLDDQIKYLVNHNELDINLLDFEG
ncbi:hypothetical protein [Epilithonimonas sp.]|uniref:hypothetical protein n=1 Tax=Epilithonimonas sp. TaxID=2894511 RepID=UPI00289D5E9E|nr:hypothetical protein [Epilithonimonas sp.]